MKKKTHMKENCKNNPQSEFVASEVLTKKIPLVLGADNVVYGKCGENMNTVIVGSPGSGKTVSNIIPTLKLDNECSIILDDKKGNLYRILKDKFQKNGYKVLLFDLKNKKSNFNFNPFRYCKKTSDYIEIANMLYGANKHDVQYWDETAKSYISQVLEVGHIEYGEKFNLGKC